MAISDADKNFLVSLYVGYFNRAPDPAGLQYWIDQVEAGRDTNTIAADFAASTEAKALYPFLTTPDVSSPTAFITSVYQNLFNRAPDAAGLAFWEGQLSAGTVSAADMIDAIIKGATTAPDSTVMNNKTDVGLDFATDTGNTPGFTYNTDAASAATAAISGVTDDTATVAAAKTATDAFIAGGGGAEGTTFTLTTSVDNFTGTANNDTFVAINEASIAAGDTLSVADSIDGGAGTDTLNITNTQDGELAGLSSTNVENVVIRSTNENDAPETLNMSNLTGATSVTLNKFTDGVTVSNAVLGTTFALNDANMDHAADDVIIGYASATGTADSASISTSNSTLEGVQVDAIETLSLKNSGDKATSIATLDAAQATTINVENTSTATAGLTITAVGDNTATKMVFTGSGKTTANGALSTGLTTIDGSAATGVLDLNVSTNTNNMTLTTGSGDDRIEAGTVGTNLTTNDTWDLGSGTNTLAIDDTSLTTQDIADIKAVKNVNVLELTSTTAETAVDFANVGTINAFKFSGAITDTAGTAGTAGAPGTAGGSADNAALILTGVENSDTITVAANMTGGAGGAGGAGNVATAAGGAGGNGSNAINITEELAGGSNSTTITLSGGIGLTGGAGGDGGNGNTSGNGGNGGNGGIGVNAATLETVNIVSSGTTANTIAGGAGGAGGTTGSGTAGTAGTAGASVAVNTNGTINVTGTQDLNLGTISGTNSSVDGSAFTGKLTVTGEAGNNIIKGGSKADTLDGGAGQDILTGGEGADTFKFFAGQSGGDVNTNLDQITDFNTGGSDKIDFDATLTIQAAATAAVAGTAQVNAEGFATFAAADDTLSERIDAVANTTNSDGDFVIFEFGSDSYVYINGDGDTTADADDALIKLVGVTGLSNSTIDGSGDLTIA